MCCMNYSTVSYCSTQLAAVQEQPPFYSIWLPAVTLLYEPAASSPPPRPCQLGCQQSPQFVSAARSLPPVWLSWQQSHSCSKSAGSSLPPVQFSCRQSLSCSPQLAAVSLLFKISWQQSPSCSKQLLTVSLLFTSAASCLPPVQLSCQQSPSCST